jgi:hypothetical protein
LASAFARRFFLAGDGLALAFARPRIGARALTATRQTQPVAQAAIRTNIHKALDVELNFGAKVALYR